MPQLTRIDFDLGPLRAEVAPLFAAYDGAVAGADRQRAKAAKEKITRTAMRELKACVPANARGLYFFAGESDQLTSLTYIGIASLGTLARRMEHRFRDETCLDLDQYGRSREDIWDTAYKRLCTSMGSKPELLVRYAFNHVRTTALFEKADRLMFFVTDAGQEAIKAAESLLIYSAISAGAPLINIQERDNLTADFASGEGLALEVIHRGGIESKHWSHRASLLLSRFRGECC